MKTEIFKVNIAFKELENVYRKYSKYCNLPDAAIWILYALKDSNKDYAQKDLSELWSLKKQTVNSALKVLMKKQYVILESFKDNKKNKKISLTKLGEEYILNHLDEVASAEQNVINSLTNEELNLLLKTLSKYSNFLDYEITKLINSKK